MSAVGDAVRSATPLVAGLAAVLLATRRRVIRAFHTSGAIAPASAIVYTRASPLTGRWRRRLRSAGVLKALADGRYWLDESAWAEYRAVRGRRALAVLGAALIVLAALALMGIVRAYRLPGSRDRSREGDCTCVTPSH